MQSLSNTLRENLQLPEKKMNYFISFIESIISSKSINSDKRSHVIKHNLKDKLIYRMLKTFFKDFNLFFTYFANLLLNIVSL